MTCVAVAPTSLWCACDVLTPVFVRLLQGVKMPPDANELVWLYELAAEVRETFVLDKVVNVFSADCLYHTSLQLLWLNVEVNGTKLGEAVQSWYFDDKVTHLVDSCTTFMCNDSCL